MTTKLHPMQVALLEARDRAEGFTCTSGNHYLDGEWGARWDDLAAGQAATGKAVKIAINGGIDQSIATYQLQADLVAEAHAQHLGQVKSLWAPLSLRTGWSVDRLHEMMAHRTAAQDDIYYWSDLSKTMRDAGTLDFSRAKPKGLKGDRSKGKALPSETLRRALVAAGLEQSVDPEQFIAKVSANRSELEQLRSENEDLRLVADTSTELEDLRAENAHLKVKLAEVEAALAAAVMAAPQAKKSKTPAPTTPPTEAK